MAAPSQEYPSWLTPSVSIITDAAGVPITTSTTVLFLPLTYYGPSIPLNSDWTYGGLFPPSSTLVPTTSEMPPTITSITNTPATPTSSLTITSATPSVSLSSPTVSLSTSSASSFSSTSTPTTTPIVTSSGGLSRGQRIGVIVASILGLIFLFVLALSLFLWWKGRRNRRRDPRFSMITPIDEGYAVVGAEGRSLGEGSPRHSGEEADSFLRRSRAAGSPQQSDAEMGGRSSAPPYSGVPRVPVPPTGSLSSSGTSSTNHSGYGVLIERPTLNLLPGTQEELARERRGQILTPEEMRRLDEETVLPHPSADGSPLLPPPRLVDPEFAWTPPSDRPAFKPQSSYLSQVSSYPDAEESATLLTARRVRVEDLAPRSPPRLPLTPLDIGSGASNNGFLAGLGQGLANIGRLSWFKNLDGHPPRGSRPQSYLSTPLTDEDLEHGKALLGGPQMSETRSSRGLGFGSEGDRPISTVSARSAATIYHDAFSSLPTTPVLAAPLAPLPRAMTPSGPDQGWPSSSTVAGEPPAYDLVDTSVNSPSPSTSATHLNHGLPVGFDILDVPAPSAVSPFASTSSVGSLREMSTGSSAGIITHPFPPGLGLGTNKSWTDITSSAAQVQAPFAVVSSHNTNAGISIDILEEAPPSAGEGWRSMASTVNFGGPGRRTTFGGFVPPDIAEEASLYSIRSHNAPSRSTGSAPASRRDMTGSNGSASSRPSAFSAARTGSSGHSLAHSGSITSEDRKRGHVSPTMSAFGHGHRSDGEPPLSPLLNTPPLVHFAERAGTVRSITSGTTAVDTLAGSSAEPGSPRSQLTQFSSAPWAGGLDQDWTPM
ncbi:hypothetical protein BDZ94DRAFT_1269228 [Collybia nuda]|uniref:Uncharacterized protein n=1 Tax=Collybia nuda TaxID=64659 RepID=A0A9P6CED3_9AGAR|nr:hypothetical protein BDZ94DRAFT_1269228 [Collybia nuda]